MVLLLFLFHFLSIPSGRAFEKEKEKALVPCFFQETKTL
jgi:hypothetical protein